VTSLGVELSGQEQLDTAVAAVTEVLTAPALAAEAVQLVHSAARPVTPTDTGQLAASAMVAGAQLVYAAPHAVFVSASQPWLGDAIAAAVPLIEDLYATRVTEAWGT
jgi:hypothetical protein